jgi:hypothetical protein
VCDRVLALDPLRNGLSAEEEYRHSRNLLQLVLNNLNQCAGPASAEPTSELMEAAAKELKKRGSTPNDIELAERLWQMRRTACRPAVGDSDEALVLVMGKLAQ